MTRIEFINYITSIGFEYNKYSYNYYYENYIIILAVINYSLYNGKEYFYDIPFADLTYFIKIQRSIKLKKLLK